MSQQSTEYKYSHINQTSFRLLFRYDAEELDWTDYITQQMTMEEIEDASMSTFNQKCGRGAKFKTRKGRGAKLNAIYDERTDRRTDGQSD